MTDLPEDIAEGIRANPAAIRQVALEQALKYALRSADAVDSTADRAPRAHVMALANVALAWAQMAEALKGTP